MIERRMTGRVPRAVVRTNDWSILMVSNGKALQIGERGMAGAEIVERQAGAEFLDAGQHLRGMLGIFHDQRFGDLELERAARQRGAAQHAAQILDQIVAQQLPRRHVHAGEDRLARTGCRLPLRELLRGVVEHEQAEIDDQPDFLGDRDEFRRRQAAQLGVIPACQRLEAGDGAIFQPHDRLVEHLDFLALDGAAQFRFHRQAVGLARAHGRLEDFDAVAADALGVVHRELGVLEHFIGPCWPDFRRAPVRSKR